MWPLPEQTSLHAHHPPGLHALPQRRPDDPGHMSVKCSQTAQCTSGQPSFYGRRGWSETGPPVLCPRSSFPPPTCPLCPEGPWSAVPGCVQAPGCCPGHAGLVLPGREHPLSSERLLGRAHRGCLWGESWPRRVGVQDRGAGPQGLRGRKHIPGALHRWGDRGLTWTQDSADERPL